MRGLLSLSRRSWPACLDLPSMPRVETPARGLHRRAGVSWRSPLRQSRPSGCRSRHCRSCVGACRSSRRELAPREPSDCRRDGHSAADRRPCVAGLAGQMASVDWFSLPVEKDGRQERRQSLPTLRPWPSGGALTACPGPSRDPANSGRYDLAVSWTSSHSASPGSALLSGSGSRQSIRIDWIRTDSGVATWCG